MAILIPKFIKKNSFLWKLFMRQIKTYVLRAGRMGTGQMRAFELYGPQFLLPYRPERGGFVDEQLAGSAWRVYYLQSPGGEWLVAAGQFFLHGLRLSRTSVCRNRQQAEFDAAS